VLAGLWSSLTDLVLPAACAGCGAAGRRLTFDTCPSCVAEVSALRATAVRPTPAPAGLPPCVALGPYDGVLRELLLSYKERGRVGLARPLGALLAEAVATVVEPAEPVRIIYVPDTAAAARARYGDHMSRIARAARLRLREAGHQVIVGTPLVARPKTDSTELGARERLIAAAGAFAIRPAELREVRRATGRTLLVDDIITTGGTAAAAASILDQHGVPVSTCVTLAATARRTSRSVGQRA
jgi:predicted amidophosphoribosyltransferase